MRSTDAESVLKIWEEARRSLPHHIRPVSDENWAGYWDRVSADYRKNSGTGTETDREIVRYMEEGGWFAPGDSVLDIGCGPGTFSLLFAELARKVRCLDLSPGMLQCLREKAQAAGLQSIETVERAWEDYSSVEKSDLVFSSFCPALNHPEALLKMELHSDRSCCYVSIADPGLSQPIYELWKILAGESYSNRGYDVALPAAYLKAAGRSPTVKVFRTHSCSSIPMDKAIENFSAYFRLFMPDEPDKMAIIKEYVKSRSEGGTFTNSADRSVGVVCWDVVGRSSRKAGEIAK